LGIGDWGLGIGPNPQSPIPNPQSPYSTKFNKPFFYYKLNQKLEFYINDYNIRENKVYKNLNILLNIK
jgi:hypothetical protein